MNKNYRKKGVQHMRPYREGETLDMNVSISQADKDNGSPKVGDMIATNVNDPLDQWLVAEAFFQENYEPAGDNFNPETVGSSDTTSGEDRTQAHIDGITYGAAIEHMAMGGIVARQGWNGKGMYVFKQVPSKVPADVVPKMSSLPDSVKERMQHDGIAPDYQSQMAIVKPDGSIDSWVASSADTFATDWVLL